MFSRTNRDFFCFMKYLLEDDFEYDFSLYGISSHEKDYRVCWAVNKALDLSLTKQNDKIEVFHKRQNRYSHHSIFSEFDFEKEEEVHLISNRTKSGYLIPEQKHADYLLMVKGDAIVDKTEIVQKLRQIHFILMCFEIEVSLLKSKDNLMF